MRQRLIHPLLFGLSLFLVIQASGQEQKKVTGNFEGYSFPRLAARLEAETGYHFYYDPADLDSLSIYMTVNKATIQQILDQLFQNTHLHYAIDPSGRVFITKDISRIRTNFRFTHLGRVTTKGRGYRIIRMRTGDSARAG